MSKQRLLVITDRDITIEQAAVMKNELEDRLKVPVTVLNGIRQAVLITESDDE